MDRRKFLKASGAAGAVVGGVGLGFFGYEAGRDPDSYTGWKNREGGFQTFNRIKWAVEKPTYKKTGPSRRVDARTEVVFSRMSPLFRNWKEEEGTNSLPEYLKKFYETNPEVLELDLRVKNELFPKLRKDR
ncbi:MAG: twin-arginine translocation signal domain-containing protein, partial [Candidatus Aminicenantes bacterium]|nr:twin-arginine translocation signal domain-containing protein [Candidatus Aminicenantes bacterium]